MAAHVPVSAAILCGGKGRRLGGVDKSRLVVDGRSFVERQLEVLRTLTPHLLLVDRDLERTCPPGVRAVADLVPGTGPLGGILTALEAATTDYTMIVACDMPYLTGGFLAYLVAQTPGVDAVIPADAAGRHVLCGVFHRGVAPAFRARIERRALRVDEALRDLCVRTIPAATVADFDTDGRLLLNVNTQDDYRRATAGHLQGTAFA
jgi:molybdopterin-guanine dinucleotide biosynthesis protein A